ncbi:MAG: zinc ribbon domain-containing protein [Thermomicrobiales bacterium]|nr:zinc ribbon domain-containing protein [Thermomicrobiales bacterium]
MANKTCPDCGAVNEPTDLFCRECGASLAMVTAANQNQQTAAFTPIPNTGNTSTMAVVPVPDQSTIAPYPPYTGVYEPVYESPRGAVLGWLAATLIVIVIGLFLWATVFSDSVRDGVTGIF